MTTLTAPAVILGGLPIIAEVHFWRDEWTGEGNFEVCAIYWQKSRGRKGKPVSQKVWDRAEARDPYFCDLAEQVEDYHAGQSDYDEPPLVLLAKAFARGAR